MTPCDDLVGLLRLGIANRRWLRRGMPLFWLGNDFFATSWMPRCTRAPGSSGPGWELEEGQEAKLHRIAGKAELETGHRVLENGCGWGSFAELAAGEYGCRVTGLTISAAQAEYARRRVRRAGLEDLVRIELRDYRTVRERYPRYRRRPDYMQTFIFPGSHLPSLGHVSRILARRTSLGIEGIENIGLYAETLWRGRDRLQARADEVRALGFDDTFLRRWESYLAFCEAGFAERTIRVRQIVLSRAGNHALAPGPYRSGEAEPGRPVGRWVA